MDIDRDTVVELVPHYVALIALVFLVLAAVEALVGDPGFWVELAIVFAVAIAYRPLVVRLGVAPSAWEGERDELLEKP